MGVNRYPDYLTAAGGTITGSLTISTDLTVSGNTSVGAITSTVTSGNNLTLTKTGNTPTLKWVGGGSNDVYMDLSSGTFRILNNGSTEILQTSQAGSVIVGSGSAPTSATDGFLYIPSCSGIPTGVPTAYAGRVAFRYDATNNKLYIYNGAWKSVALT